MMWSRKKNRKNIVENGKFFNNLGVCNFWDHCSIGKHLYIKQKDMVSHPKNLRFCVFFLIPNV